MASESEYTDGGASDAAAPPSLAVANIKETLLTPLRIAISPAFLRAYLRTLLLFITSSVLFALAVLAYSAFYYKYIPVRGIEVPVYLQVDTTPSGGLGSMFASDTQAQGKGRVGNSEGVALVRGLVGRQKYDVVVEMRMPRTERNVGAGNWMVGVDVRGVGDGAGTGAGAMGTWDELAEAAYDDQTTDTDKADSISCTGRNPYKTCRDANGNLVPPRPDPSEIPTCTGRGRWKVCRDSDGKAIPLPLRKDAGGAVLAASSRPALMTHRTWLATLAHTALRLPLYALNLRTEAETVRVPMMEGVTFSASDAAPFAASVGLDIRSPVRLDVYGVSVLFEAKLEGLRWFMYRHWILSAVFFTSAFWVVEVGVLVLSWAVFAAGFHNESGVKQEERDSESEHGESGDEAEGSGRRTPERQRNTRGQESSVTEKSGEEDGEDTGGAEVKGPRPLTPPPETETETGREFHAYGTHAGPSARTKKRGGSDSGSRKFKEEPTTPMLRDIPFSFPQPRAPRSDHYGAIEWPYEEDDEDEDADFVRDKSLTPGNSVSVAVDSGVGTSVEGSRAGNENGSGKVKRDGG